LSRLSRLSKWPGNKLTYKRNSTLYSQRRGAGQTGKSFQLLARVKGRAEKYLLDLPPSSNIKPAIIRPGYFFPGKDDAHIRSSTAKFMDKIATPLLSTLAPSVYTPVGSLAQVALALAKGQWSSEKDRVFGNVRMKDLLNGFKASDSGKKDDSAKSATSEPAQQAVS
jgi:hypothetical protein